MRETHISWVFLAGELAYKLKKPLVLDFLDYGTPARRREMCGRGAAEPSPRARSVLGVRGVALADDGVELTDEEDPRAVEFVVEMGRYDEAQTLGGEARARRAVPTNVVEVGRLLAHFHEGASRVTPDGAPVLAAERRFDRNLQELLGDVEQRGEIERVQGLERFAHAFVTAHAQTFWERASRGQVREGQGDLRAEHVLLDDRVRIVDCVEFDPGCADSTLPTTSPSWCSTWPRAVASASARSSWTRTGMPAATRARRADRVLRRVPRARARQGRAAARRRSCRRASAEHGRRSAHARDLVSLAERFAWRARRPLVIAACGVPASGKSHLAHALAELSGLPHLSSDVIRKRLAGLRPTERAPGDTYGADWNARTYAELGRRASEALARNGGAIVDATFRHREDRRAFTAVLGARRQAVFIECQAPGPVLGRRAAHREHDHDRVSDAGLAVVVREQSRWEALDEIAASATYGPNRPPGGADHRRRAGAARPPLRRARPRLRSARRDRGGESKADDGLVWRHASRTREHKQRAAGGGL